MNLVGFFRPALVPFSCFVVGFSDLKTGRVHWGAIGIVVAITKLFAPARPAAPPVTFGRFRESKKRKSMTELRRQTN